MCTTNHARRRSAGFTLPELLLLIVVFSLGLSGILLVFNNAVRGSADPLVRKQALAAAESMLDEILLQPYANPAGGWSGAASQANRANFDDVQDYSGFATTGIYAINGVTPISGLESYNVVVAVGANALGSVPSTAAVRITVTVSGPGTSVSLEGYKVNVP